MAYVATVLMFLTASLQVVSVQSSLHQNLSDSCIPEDLLLEQGATYLDSPNYPKSYPRQYYCEWKAIGARGQPFVYIFPVAWSMEHSKDCQYDFISINSSSLKKPSRLCKIELGLQFNYSLPIAISFRTDDTSQHSGFRLILYSSASDQPHDIFRMCEEVGTLSAEFGKIQFLTSPLWPAKYDRDKGCHIQIHALSSEYYVQITRFRLKTEEYHDFVIIREGLSRSNPMVWKWSGTSYDVPVEKFIASDHRIQVMSQSDSQHGDYGFVLGFEAVFRNQTRPTLHEATDSEINDRSRISTGLGVGVAFGLAALLVCLCYCYTLHRRKKKKRRTMETRCSGRYAQDTAVLSTNLLLSLPSIHASRCAPPTYEQSQMDDLIVTAVISEPPPSYHEQSPIHDSISSHNEIL